MSALDKIDLVPDTLSQVRNPTSPAKFTEKLLNGTALTVESKGANLLRALGFDAKERELEPDFYMPDGKGSKLSETHCLYTIEETPEDNPGVLVKLDNLEKKYGTSLCVIGTGDMTNRRKGTSVSTRVHDFGRNLR